MLLSDIFKGAPQIEINQLASDSRMPMKDAIFFCVKGIKDDGHAFVSQAIKNGAKVIVYDGEVDRKENAIYIKVNNVDDALINVASKFYNDPLHNMETYVVSGCYGRSSVALLINSYLKTVKPSGYIGRFGINYNNISLMLYHPTLTILDNYKYLNNMARESIKTCTFEASASSLAYRKLDFIKPNVFVYTNSSEYSSDYKEAGDDYYSDMRRYLYSLENNTKIVLNRDDKAYKELVDSVESCYTYGTNEESDFIISEVHLSRKGIAFILKYKNVKIPIVSPLLGINSVYNLTAAIVSLLVSGYSVKDIVNYFRNVKQIDGVMESIDSEYSIIVDCGYTLDSVNRLLEFSRKIKNNNHTIGVISISFSDEEDKLKPLMEKCEEYLDTIILTEDDSNSEDRFEIINKATTYLHKTNYIVIEDRKVAIETAIELMNKNDLLLLSGKGNENFLYTYNGKISYDTDKKIALNCLNKRRKEENEIIEVY